MGDKSPVVTPAVAPLTQSSEIDGTESLSVASKPGQIVKTRPSGGVGPEWEGVQVSADMVPGEATHEAFRDRAMVASEPTTSSSTARTTGRSTFARLRTPALLVAVDLCAAAIVLALSGSPWWLTIVGAVALAVANFVSGLDRSRFTLSALDDAPILLIGSVLVGLATALTVLGLGIAGTQPWLLVVLPAVVIVARAMAYFAVRSLRKRGRIRHRALILGAGSVGHDLAHVMIDHRQYGLDPVGFIDGAPLWGPEELPVPVLGGPADLADRIVDLNVSHVVVAFTSMPERDMVEMLRTCDRLQADISVVPRLFELTHRRRDSDDLNGMALMRLHRAPFRSPMWHLKRLMDIVVAGTALVVLAPLMAVVALAVRYVDGPHVIFRQKRVGLDGESFDLMKFRSLRPIDVTEADTRWNVKNDDRMSWLGRVIRVSCIDELPQLVNIVRGDMSLVGPRPERPHFVEAFDDAFPRYGARHRVPSGLTGWAQIHGLRGDTSIEERARFDNYYIENWSLWLDIKIILRTVATLTKGSG